MLYHSSVGHKLVEHDKLTTDELEPVRGRVEEMRATLRNVLEEQTYQRARDALHLALNVSTGRRSVVWALIEAAGMIGVSIAQVFVIKQLFKDSGGGLSPSSSSPRWGRVAGV